VGLPEGVRSTGPSFPARPRFTISVQTHGARALDPSGRLLSTLSHALLDMASPEAVRSEGNVVCLAANGRVTRSLALTHTLALLTSLTLGLLALIKGRGEGAAACPSRP